MSNLFNVLKYFSVLTALLDLIRLVMRAEELFGDGNGTAKFSDVIGKWNSLIGALRTTGLLSERIASALIAGAPAIIETAVAVFHTFGIFKKKEEPTPGPTPAPEPGPTPTHPAYATVFDGPYPGDAQVIALGYRDGRDFVHQNEDPPRWAMQKSNFLAINGVSQTHRLGERR